ncbi:hypothetical protein Hypma_004075 [Hypsizygus marmoreus]|uniref:Uncharacterized protein n=1 Tax=Hypsizygus marmoreus TaxID=39966 RepID=A0A369J0Q7_HYPMA|nr:hypothetical protein Hypma_004075 [Hypsizygus marmoreus]
MDSFERTTPERGTRNLITTATDFRTTIEQEREKNFGPVNIFTTRCTPSAESNKPSWNAAFSTQCTKTN